MPRPAPHDPRERGGPIGDALDFGASASSRQEIDLFITLADGVYFYDAKAHALTPVLAGDLRGATGTQPFAADAPVNLVYVADLKK